MFCICICICICICWHSGIICNWVQCIAITSGRDGGVCLIPALITTGWHAYHALPRQGWQCWVADDFSHPGEIVTILANEQSFGYMTTWRDSDHNQWCHQSSEEMALCFKDDSCTNANLYCLIFLISYIGFELMTAAAKEPSWRCHRPLLGVWCLVIYCTFFGPFFWSTSSHKVNLSSFKMTVAYLPS